MPFEFTTANRIVFGNGASKDIANIVSTFGTHVFVVTSHGGADAGLLIKHLADQALQVTAFEIFGEPTINQVIQGVTSAKENQCDVIIGYGGGSAIDMAKAVGMMLTNPGELLDYLEVIGLGKVLKEPGLPVIAIPTTAGTGAEVTRNAVLASPEHKVKVSLRSAMMLPKVAIIDPELTYSLPAPVTASTGMDAITQVIEPYVSIRANSLTDALCKEAIPRGASVIVRAYENGSDAFAREEMAMVSLFGGLALANAGLGAVHGFAAPMGGSFNAPHGAICARLLAPVMEINIRAIKERLPDSMALQRYGDVAKWLTGSQGASLEDGVKWLYELCRHLEIPGLTRYGFHTNDIDEMVEKGAVASSMKANPVKLTQGELREIIEKAL
jgi:alcohol dehydrogenase class IV